jgi:hypothetical protein
MPSTPTIGRGQCGRHAVERELRARRIRVERHRRGARVDVAEAAVRDAVGIGDGQVDAVPLVRILLADARERECASLHAGDRSVERVRVVGVVKDDRPRESRSGERAVFGVGAGAGV